VVPQVRAVILSDYGKGFLTPHILKTIIQRAREANIPVLVDPKGLDYSRYWGATYITPNLKEASLASGIIIRDEETLLEAGRLLLEQTHAEGLVVTRGREGSTLITRDSMQDFPVKPVEIIDVTGAGDTVIAALALCVANGLSIEDSVRVANLAATLVVTRFGAASVTLREMADAVAEQAQTAKVVTQKDISRLLSSRRIQGARVVFTNGCFDIFHAGHLKSLSEAAKLGDILVVGINSDASVTRIKGPERPVMSRQDRVDLVSALSFVDYVVVFEEDTPLELIEEVRPDILVKGEDWEGKHVVGEDIVRGRGGRVAFIKHVEGISTSDLIKRIRGE
jgi:D-beta-D-heptose 7-phosphate kinase/D-beta-D-heptose 1-phosphate adenosyltransferase